MIFAVIICFALFLILMVSFGIWEIHKSINALTAVQIRQAEALEKIANNKAHDF